MIRYNLLSLFILLALVGCSAAPVNPGPVLPDLTEPLNGLTDETRETVSLENSHQLWFSSLIFVDPGAPDGVEFEILPLRQVSGHWNILTWLENGPCFDCFKLVNVQQSGYGTLLVNIEITHPFDNMNFTGFDVRGICMFDGSREFPEAGLVLSDRDLGDGELVNAEGYTSLYNSTTEGHGMEGYIKGNLATVQPPSATLNGYIRHITDDPSNTRNAFYAGDAITATYEIVMPDGPFVFGYAVDASWQKATNLPVTDPMTDFPLEASCTEAWKIHVVEVPVGDGLTDCGGWTFLQVDVYDWQGKDDIHPPVVECPELFDGIIESAWIEDGPDYTRYGATVENLLSAGPGEYKCLVGVTAQENDPIGKPWLDLSAYQLISLSVTEYANLDPVAVCEAGATSTVVGEPLYLDASESYDSDCYGESIVKYEWDWYGGGIFFEGDAEEGHVWNVVGTYDVQVRVTDDEGSADTLDEPLVIDVISAGPYPPVACFEASWPSMPDGPLICEEITLDASCSYDQDGDIVQYLWDINGDGVYGDNVNGGIIGTYTYNEMGHFSIRLKVRDNDGYSGISEPLDVLISHGQPTAIAIADSLFVEVNQDIQFDGTESYDGDCDGSLITQYEWDFSYDPLDGFQVESNEPQPVKSYPSAGTYRVNLRVKDDEGSWGILDEPLEVTVISDDQPTPVDVTPRWLNLVPEDVCVDGDYVYMAAERHGVHIFDVSDEENPIWVNAVQTTGQTIALDASDGHVFVAEDTGGVEIIDIYPPESAYVVKHIDTPGNAIGIEVSDGYAYVADNFEGLQIIDVDPIGDALIVKTVEIPPCAMDVAVQDGYAYFATYQGLAVVDIDPVSQAYVTDSLLYGELVMAVDVEGDYAYLPLEFTGFNIIDISDPTDISVAYTVDASDNIRDLKVANGYLYIGHEHFGIFDVDPPESAYQVAPVTLNVYDSFVYGVDVDSGYAYLANNRTGLEIIDINPAYDAELVGEYRGIRVARCADVTDDQAFVGGNRGFHAIDMTVPESAVLEFTYDMWYHFSDMDILGEYLHGTFDNHGYKVMDVYPLEDTDFVCSVPTENHARAMCIDGDYAYVADGTAGLQIIDINPVGDASIVNTVSSGLESWDEVIISDGYAYISGFSSNFFIVDIDPVGTAHIVNEVVVPTYSMDMDIQAGYAYIAGGYNGLHILDIDPIDEATLIDTFTDGLETAHAVTVDGGYAYVGDGGVYELQDETIKLVDIFPLIDIHVVDAIEIPDYAGEILIHDGYIYASCYDGGLRILDLWQ